MDNPASVLIDRKSCPLGARGICKFESRFDTPQLSDATIAKIMDTMIAEMTEAFESGDIAEVLGAATTGRTWRGELCLTCGTIFTP